MSGEIVFVLIDAAVKSSMDVARSLRVRSLANFGTVAMAQRSRLRARVSDILNPQRNRRAVSRRWTIVFFFLATFVFLPLSLTHLGRRSAVAAQPIAATQPTTQAVTATQPSNTMRVTVLDKSTGKAVAGARLEVDGMHKSASVVTDPAGHAMVEFTDSTYCWLTIHAAHLVPQRMSWDRNKAKLPADWTVSLEPGTTIAGKVIDDAGQPIAGATVGFYIRFAPSHTSDQQDYFPDEKVVCGADGTWRADDLPEHFDKVYIGAWDRQHLQPEGYYPMDDFSPVSKLRDGSATFVLTRGTPVGGTVYGPDDKPIAGARVELGADRNPSNIVPALKTDEQGTFSCAVKPGEMIVLTATAKGCAADLQQALLADKPLTIDFHLKRGNVLSGSIVNSDGKPVPNATIWFDTWRGYRTIRHTSHADSQGNFTWADAPSDTVYADVDAAGLTRQNHVAMTAGMPVKIVMAKQMVVTGSVTDAETGKPINSYRMIHGEAFNMNDSINWDRRDRPELGSGTFSFSPGYPYPYYGLRIEADGYLPAESRTFTDSEGHVDLTFKLVKGRDVSFKVLAPDGKPAAGATAILIDPGQSVILFNGGRSLNDAMPQARVEADGSVRFPADGAAFKLVVFGEPGYIEATAEQCHSGQPIVLASWAQISGALHIGKGVGAGEKIAVDLAADNMFDPASQRLPRVSNQIETTTDSAGHFAFDRVPPGKVRVSREIVQSMGQMWMAMRAQTKTVELSPGETATINLGGMGRPVIGQILIPSELKDRQWVFRGTQAISNSKPPEFSMPADVQAKPPQERTKWMVQFQQSDAGKTYFKARQNFYRDRPSYPVKIAQDGTFRIDDVPAGTYRADFAVMRSAQAMNDALGSATVTFTVPEMPGGRSDEALVLPAAALELNRTISIGDAVPDFTAKTLEGHDLKLSAFRGKYVLLDFWATWCGPCVAETPSIKAAFDAYGNNDRLALISLSLDQKPDDAKRYVEQNKLAWNQVFLPGGWDSAVVKDYGVRGIPSIWLIGPDGKVIAKDLRGEAIKQAIALAVH